MACLSSNLTKPRGSVAIIRMAHAPHRKLHLGIGPGPKVRSVPNVTAVVSPLTFQQQLQRAYERTVCLSNKPKGGSLVRWSGSNTTSTSWRCWSALTPAGAEDVLCRFQTGTLQHLEPGKARCFFQTHLSESLQHVS